MKNSVLLLLLGLVSTAIFAQEQNSTQSKIIAMEKAWNQAFKLRDKKALSEILDDSIVLVNGDGSLAAKADFLSAVESANKAEDQQAEPESIAVHVFGDVAIATGVFREKGVENGKPYIRRDRFVDTWVNKKGTWVCVAASATPLVH